MSAPVNVLAVMTSFVMNGKEFVPSWNRPFGTGLVANRARYRGGRLYRNPSTQTVLAALERAERDGIVTCVGTGAEHCRAWNKNAADTAEKYWTLTDASLATIGGAA
ncbi:MULTISPECIES: hypothetical protein [unclassified Rhodanobacter]|uniref:hypothetical protein n=1 Tax=unclassified Rhodanobacter TaxID=2621553 RepID=UPI001BDE2C21|nr:MULTISPECIES: hypothetical protein [unclassified Rhodanobacter]MBT2142720.1 hypothetical protein [Rhodanobacter sp. LX-99]MBT2148207.1 hypothetical protein [Rhodanobacter sp. LX-100]